MTPAQQPTLRRPRHRRSAGLIAVTLILMVAGLLFSTSARTARGSQLRADQTDLMGLVQDESDRVKAKTRVVEALRQELDAQTRAGSTGNDQVSRLQQQSQTLALTAGLRPVSGPGVVVSLDDAPRGGAVPPGAKPDDLVVHQQDVQAVVNALWDGGAEAMMLMDQRVISTSAVRCVGNTLILKGRVYSPPFVVTALGDPRLMQLALNASEQVRVYREYVDILGLGWKVRTDRRLQLPAYNGSLELRYARIAGGSAGSGSGSTPSTGATSSNRSTATPGPTSAGSTTERTDQP